MKRILLSSLLMLIGATALFCGDFSAKIDTLKDHCDLTALQSEYDALRSADTNDPTIAYQTGKTESALVYVIELQNGENAGNKNKILEAAEYCKKAITAGKLSNEDAADACFTIAQLYDRLIRDAASWMQYNADKGKFLKICAQYNPDHLGAKILSATSLLNLPENAGGNPAKGKELLDKLYAEHPENLTILIALSNDRQNQKDLEKAEEILKKIVLLYPEYTYAQKTIDEFALMKKEPVIHGIEIQGNPKTSKERILGKVSRFIGEKYSFNVKNKIFSRMCEISSIGGGSIKASMNDDGTVDLIITVNENNMRMMAAIGSGSVSLNFDKKPSFSGFPALMYMDQNFFGTANALTVIFAGPYINLDYSDSGLINDKYIDMKIHWESMFLENATALVENGKSRNDLAIQGTQHMGSIGFGKAFPFGLSAFVGVKADFRNWKMTKDNYSADFTTPASITYIPGVNLSFSTVGGSNGSKMDLLSGFALQFTGESLYQPAYIAWGKKDALYEHDGKSEFRFSAVAEYDLKFLDCHNLRFKADYRTGINMYELGKWSTGRGTLMSSDACVDGFYAGEFRYTTGVIGNVTYQINLIPSKFSTYTRYSAFLNLDDKKIWQGTAFGGVAKLPYDIEIAGQVGIGLNAQREKGPGFEFDLMLMKMWML